MEQTEEVKRGRGRPKGYFIKITPEKEREILAILAIGGSRNDAAEYVGVSRSTLHETIDRNEDFAERVKKAEADGKIKHLKKVGDANAWQASAWFLERKYPKEYGLKQTLEHSGPDGAPISISNLKGLSDSELEAMQTMLAKVVQNG